MNLTDLDDFTQGYIACALGSEADATGDPLDATYDIGDLAPETLERIVKDCRDFQQQNRDDLEQYCVEVAVDTGMTHAGYDFWLTRNRHSAGFWDRELGCLGERLTSAAHRYGEVYLYIDDNDTLSLA